MTEIIPLFSTPIIKTMIEEDTTCLNEEVKKVDFERSGNLESTVKTNKRILKKFPRVKKILLNRFKEIISNDLEYYNDFEITTSWFIKTNPEQYSQIHVHRNSFYSGVYYFDEYEEGSSPILFENPLKQHPDYYIRPKNYNILNGTTWKIWPEKNLLLLFPSYLPHNVMKNESNKIRYSLSFNIVPVGEYGGGDSTYNKEWI